MSKIKVLTISVDVSEMDIADLEELKELMELETENYIGSSLLSSNIKELDIDELMNDDEENTSH